MMSYLLVRNSATEQATLVKHITPYRQELRDAREKLRLLSLYQRFEHVVVMFLSGLIVIIVIAAVWNLSIRILFGLVLAGGLDPSD
jgi:hypothetical protein